MIIDVDSYITLPETNKTGGGFKQIFLEFSPRILGEDEAILTVRIFFHLGP